MCAIPRAFIDQIHERRLLNTHEWFRVTWCDMNMQPIVEDPNWVMSDMLPNAIEVYPNPKRKEVVDAMNHWREVDRNIGAVGEVIDRMTSVEGADTDLRVTPMLTIKSDVAQSSIMKSTLAMTSAGSVGAM